jgi:hypothetical protein
MIKMSMNEEIVSTIDAYTKHLQDWFNADIKKEELESFAQIFHDDWKIVNRNVPGFVGDKRNFMNHWITLYGKHKDDRIEYSFSKLEINQLSDLFYLVTFVEHYEFSKKKNEWPITVILKYNKDADKMTFYHTHE